MSDHARGIVANDKTSDFQDRQITCVDCGEYFTWTVGEQVFFHDKGLKNEPKRWAMYEVKVQSISSKLSGGSKSWDNYVNCTFVCHAVQKDSAGKVKEELSTSVPSTFGLKKTAQVS